MPCRRKKLMAPETALRFRTDRIRDRTKTSTLKYAKEQKKRGNLALATVVEVAVSNYGSGSAVTAWVVAQYKKNGFVPSKTEVGIAQDSGAIGRWADSVNPKKPDRVEYPDRNGRGRQKRESRKPKGLKAIGDKHREQRAKLEKRKARSAQNRALEAQIKAQLERFKSA